MINPINPVDSIVIQLGNNRQSESKNFDKMVTKPDDNVVQLNLNIKEDDLIRAVDNVNKDHLVGNEKLQYEYHEETNKYVIKIVDTKRNEVVKQIPSQKLLDYAAGLMEYIGMRFDVSV
ncbi:MAG: flagellar protein FlaG [Clostridia bacterium]